MDGSDGSKRKSEGLDGSDETPRKKSKTNHELSNDVAQWDVECVFDFVCTLGREFERCASRLKDYGVNGAIFLTLTEKEFRKDMRIESSLVIRKIMYEINRLKASQK